MQLNDSNDFMHHKTAQTEIWAEKPCTSSDETLQVLLDLEVVRIHAISVKDLVGSDGPLRNRGTPAA